MLGLQHLRLHQLIITSSNQLIVLPPFLLSSVRNPSLCPFVPLRLRGKQPLCGPLRSPRLCVKQTSAERSHTNARRPS